MGSEKKEEKEDHSQPSSCTNAYRLASRPSPTPDDGICASATWSQTAITIAGGNGQGSELNQLNYPRGLFVDDDNAVYIADSANDRVLRWPFKASHGIVVAGSNEGNQSNQLSDVTSVVVAKNGTMFVCDHYNKRVQRFKNDNQGETILGDIPCFGLAMDNEGSLYISDQENGRVVQWPSGKVVAGGNGIGTALNQFSDPYHLFVDQDQSVFIADFFNSSVVKWLAGAKEGIIVAGGNGQGDADNQLSLPTSVVVDKMGTVYVLEYGIAKVSRWFKGAKSGSVIINGVYNNTAIELVSPHDFTFDRKMETCM